MVNMTVNDKDAGSSHLTTLVKTTDFIQKTIQIAHHARKSAVKTKIVLRLSVVGIRITQPVLGGNTTSARMKRRLTFLLIVKMNIIMVIHATKENNTIIETIKESVENFIIHIFNVYLNPVLVKYTG